ncbi:MAG: hypothetical protein ACRDGV_00670 [Candidatus Limnocylindria bacterium]
MIGAGSLRAAMAFVRGATRRWTTSDRKSRRQSLQDLQLELRRELHRSRRYNRSFVMIRGSLRGPSIGKTEREAMLRAVRGRLRATDHLCVADRHVYLLLPESERTSGDLLLARLRAEVADRIPEGGLTLAAFPEDGLTIGSLLAALRKQDAEARDRMGRIPRDTTGRIPDLAQDRRAG